METSHRQILRASSIIGGATFITIILGLARVKLAAVLLGPEGVGLIGLFQNVLQVATVLGGVSLNIVGARHIAAAATVDVIHLAAARKRVAIAVAGMAVLTGIIFWLSRSAIATLVFGGEQWSVATGWLTVGVVLTIGIFYQTAVLTGLRKMGDLARSSIYSGALITGVGVASLLILGENGVLAFVLATPVCTFLVGHYYVLRHKADSSPGLSGLGEVAAMMRFGTLLTVAAAFSVVGQLIVKAAIQEDLGLAAVGYFQATWFISMTYLGFILQAMGSDFLPRLTAAAQQKDVAARLVNEQTEVSLLLSAPIVILMMALAPVLISILYTAEFAVAASILRWQILGDVLRIMSWPLGLALVAYGDGKRFALAECTSIIILVASTLAMLPYIGLESSGISVVLMNVWYLPLVYALTQRSLPIRWTNRNVGLFLSISATCVVIFIISHFWPVPGTLMGCGLSFAFAAYALNRLKDALPVPIARLVQTVGRSFPSGQK